MPEYTAKKPALLPCLLLSSLFMTSFLPGNLQQKKQTILPALPQVAAADLPAHSEAISRLQTFIRSVMNGNASQVVGIFVPGGFSYPIIQQPVDQPVYVSANPDQVTQYHLPSKYGTIGLLAHNTLAGADFFKLAVGQGFLLVYGDGTVQPFAVQAIQKFKALDPENPFSDFVDTQTVGPEITSSVLFNQVYNRPGEVVFQTCIEADGDPSWGRMFVTASPEPIQASFPKTHIQLAAYQVP